MPKTYYDSELTAKQIEDALTAINGVVIPGNNGKILYIEDGQIKAASASRWSGGIVLEPLSVTANGDYYPSPGTDGFDEVHVAVPGAGNIQPLSATQNGTYTPPSGVDGYAPVTVNVSGGGITDSIQEIIGLNGTNFARLSVSASDKMQRNDRYFQRSTNEPVIFIPSIVANGDYTGYACINFENSLPSGTYSSYGDLGYLTERVTQSGTVYYVSQITGPYPPSTEQNKVRFIVNGVEQILSIGNADAYLGDDSTLSGDAQALSLLESYIDRIYEVYYS